jgi:disulfide oxidoreductase YuzD
LHRAFGASVEVEYHDLAFQKANDSDKRWSDAIENNHIPLPVVTIDDQIIVTGGVDYWKIVKAIEEHNRVESN